jgi:hypothetical protein
VAARPVNGQVYVGEFRDDKRNGKGTLTFSNGERYVGEWKNGLKSGEGTFFAADGSRKQSGDWENDQFAGAPAADHRKQ